MQTYQASLHYTLVRLGDSDRLTHPLRSVEYMQGAFETCAHEESFWLISMNRSAGRLPERSCGPGRWWQR